MEAKKGKESSVVYHKVTALLTLYFRGWRRERKRKRKVYIGGLKGASVKEKVLRGNLFTLVWMRKVVSSYFNAHEADVKKVLRGNDSDVTRKEKKKKSIDSESVFWPRYKDLKGERKGVLESVWRRRKKRF